MKYGYSNQTWIMQNGHLPSLLKGHLKQPNKLQILHKSKIQ
jgi:hypothetical protein